MRFKVWDSTQIVEEGTPNPGANVMELMTGNVAINTVRRYSPVRIILRSATLNQICALTAEGYHAPAMGEVLLEMHLDTMKEIEFPALNRLVALIHEMGRGTFHAMDFATFVSLGEFRELVEAGWVLSSGDTEDAYTMNRQVVELYVKDAEDILADREADEIENGRMFNDVPSS
jgi:hypothetical protein